MLKCSYIILISNNESTVARVIESLKKINGNFLREFIIIDDGSTDNSLSIIKNAANYLPKTTIITQAPIGPALSINKALNLVNGDYVQFLDGKEIIVPNATSILLDACQKMETEVAIGSNYLPSNNQTNKLIDFPIKEILKSKIKEVRNIGLPGSLVTLRLLEKIQGADSHIYHPNMSLSLKCGKFSKFALLREKITIAQNNIHKNKKEQDFENYNNLMSIYNFAKNNPNLAEEYLLEFIYALGKSSQTFSNKLFYLLKYIIAKYIKKPSEEEVFEFYSAEILKLF